MDKLWFGTRNRKEFQDLSDEEFDEVVAKINEIVEWINEQ